MSRLVDASICPDCRATLAGAHCPDCGLALTGDLAVRLWQELSAADATITALRGAAVPATAEPPSPAVPSPAAPAAPVAPPSPLPPVAPPLAPTPATGGMSGKTVPAVLLVLGGLFVFVAVSLFLAVTWTVLPLAAKAALMVGFTAVVALGAAALTRRGLNGSAEVVWTLVAALVALDTSAAWRSDLLGLGSLTGRDVTAGVGMLLTVLGVGVALWATRTRSERLWSVQVVAIVGLLLITVSQFIGETARPIVGVLVLAAVTALLVRHLPVVGYGAAALAAIAWLDLVGSGIAGVENAGGRGAAWASFEGWPLLVAAVLMAGLAFVPPFPRWLRATAAGGSLGVLGLLVVLPGAADTPAVLLVSLALLAYAALALAPVGVWSTAAAVLAAVVGAVTTAALALAPVAQVLDALGPTSSWSTPLGTIVTGLGGPAPWTLLAMLVAAVAAAYALAGHADDDGRARSRSLLVCLLPSVVAYVVASVVVLSGTSLAIAVLALTAAALVAGVPAVLSDRFVAGLLPGTVAAGLALLLATRSDLLTALVATAFALVVAAGTLLDEHRDRARWYAAVPLAPVVGWAAFGWALTLDLAPWARVTLLEVLLGALLVTAAWWARQISRRLAVEVGAALSLLAVVAAHAGSTSPFPLALTLAGAALAVMSVLHRDRHVVSWAAAVVLALATFARFEGTGIGAPEVYALPLAALLIGVGWYRLHQDPAFGSWPALGAGLNLALVPSLLFALPDPASLRTLLVGIAALAVLALGVLRRWQAPFLVGGAVLTMLALRFLLPLARDILANPLGAWMLFGAAGAALLTAGILWEQSLRRIRGASRYVGALV